MEVARHQFLKISSGAIGSAVAAEVVGLGADTNIAQRQARIVHGKSGFTKTTRDANSRNSGKYLTPQTGILFPEQFLQNEGVYK
jgi:hypothetical protein